MRFREITEKQATEVLAILIEECGYCPGRRDGDAFIRHIVAPQPDGSPVCHEFRFMGSLGFGGKFRNNGNNMNTPHVDCYPEHKTENRKSMIADANKRLNLLFNPTGGPSFGGR